MHFPSNGTLYALTQELKVTNKMQGGAKKLSQLHR
jgi:hypothetical protein